jgi:TPR repeat protein
MILKSLRGIRRAIQNFCPATLRGIAQLNELAGEGFPIAHFVLGNIWLYIDDARYTADPARAMQHYLKAAELEFLPAYAMLGRMYEHGKGVDQSAFKAMEYYFEGAKRHDLECLV